MAKPRIPDKDEYQRQWASMTWSERREILKAVNKGQAMRQRKQARLAVATARQQQRYWRWAWLFAPLVALILIPNWVSVAINAALLAILMGSFSWWRHRRAAASEQANLERLQR